MRHFIQKAVPVNQTAWSILYFHRFRSENHVSIGCHEGFAMKSVNWVPPSCPRSWRNFTMSTPRLDISWQSLPGSHSGQQLQLQKCLANLQLVHPSSFSAPQFLHKWPANPQALSAGPILPPRYRERFENLDSNNNKEHRNTKLYQTTPKPMRIQSMKNDWGPGSLCPRIYGNPCSQTWSGLTSGSPTASNLMAKCQTLSQLTHSARHT